MKISSLSLSHGMLALILGIVLMFSFEPFAIYPFAILAPAGLCSLIYQASRKRAFWLGFLFGLGLFGSGVYWIFISINTYGQLGTIGSALLTGLLILYMSLFPALACSLSARFFQADKRAKILFAFPAFWMLTEWVRTWLFTGFPWLLIGYSQTNSPLKGLAPIFGVYGVSLAVMMSAALLVYAAMQMRKANYLSGYLHLFAIVAIWIFAGLCNLIPWSEATGAPIKVALVQGNIPQSLKWNPEQVQLSFNRYQQLSEPLWGKTDLIIWPEIAIPTPLQSTIPFVDDMAQKAKETNTNLIFGIPIAAPEKDGFYNSVVSVGAAENVYSKRQLVPFGEYVPFRRLMKSTFDFLQVPMSKIIPGKLRQDSFTLGNINILPSICYEITYPMLTRSYNPDISFIMTVTNDAWFGKSTAQAQHLQMAAMRSIEMSRPGVFVTNDGITAFINHKGDITNEAPAHIPYVLHGKLQPRHGLTPWMRNGIDPSLAIVIMLLLAAYYYRRQSTPKQKTVKSKK